MSSILPNAPPIEDSHLEELAIFPLPNAVFFPHTLLPLHIFEPRYRQMITDALTQQRPIAVVLLKPGYEREYEGQPSIHKIAGVGHIAHHEHLTDGRFNVILRGQARVEILEELPMGPLYRRVRARIIYEDHHDTAAIGAQMATLRGCIFGLSPNRPRLAALLSKRLGAICDPGALADNIASLLLPDQDARQNMLGEHSVSRRLQTINAFLTEILLESTPEDDSVLLN